MDASGWAVIILWVGLAALPAWLASSRGRRFGFWWFIGIVTSPVLGLVIVLMLPSLRAKS